MGRSALSVHEGTQRLLIGACYIQCSDTVLRHRRAAEVSAVCLADSMKEMKVMKERNGDRVLNVGFGAGIE